MRRRRLASTKLMRCSFSETKFIEDHADIGRCSRRNWKSFWRGFLGRVERSVGINRTIFISKNRYAAGLALVATVDAADPGCNGPGRYIYLPWSICIVGTMEAGDHPVVVLGAGLAGLAAALRLRSQPVMLVEREESVGGKARTHRRDGFVFDVTGHWLHLRDAAVRELVFELLEGQPLLQVARRATVWTGGVMVPYPFQANIHRLPRPVRQRCLNGFLGARARRLGGLGVPPANFQEFVVRQFGTAMADHFFVPYYTKFWGFSLDRLTADWLARYFPMPSTAQVIGGALGMRQDRVGYNARFLYPAKGGIDVLPRAFLAARTSHGNLAVRLSTDIEELDPARRRIKLTGTQGWLRWHALVSTIPLPDLLDRIPVLPAHVRAARAQLRSIPLRYLNIGLRSPSPMREHWVYVPDRPYPFYRMGVYSNAAPQMAPPGCAALWVELTDRTGPVNLPGVLDGLIRMGAITSVSNVLFTEQHDVAHAYVVFDDARLHAVAAIMGWLAERRVFSCGRYGGWTYGSMEDAILDGFTAAARIMALTGPPK
jgi:protoporphyrinogen oxidase